MIFTGTEVPFPEIKMKFQSQIVVDFPPGNNEKYKEISQSSQFTLIVTFTHLFFFGWYVTSILFTRTVGQDFFGGYINYTVMRGVFCATPTYNLVIVFIGFKALQHLNSKRNNKISTTVQIKSTGHEGAKNYDDAIANYWDYVYIRMNK